MKRNTLNFWIDAASAMVFCGLIATGLLTRFVLPPGSGSRRLLWGLDRHDWGDVHFWVAVAGGALLLIHVALHWQWVCVTVLRPFHRARPTDEAPLSRWRRNVLGCSLVAVLFGLFWGFVLTARLWVKDNDAFAGTGGGREQSTNLQGSHAGSDDELIRGSMTLAEAAAAGSMPVEALRTRLGLPERVSADEKLGRLSREHGFSMNRVREVVREDQRQSPATQPKLKGK